MEEKLNYIVDLLRILIYLTTEKNPSLTDNIIIDPNPIIEAMINEFDKQAADVRALPYILLGADPGIPAQTYVALTNNSSNVELYSEHRDDGKFEVSFLNLANGTIRDGIINEGKAEFLDSTESTTQIEMEK